MRMRLRMSMRTRKKRTTLPVTTLMIENEIPKL